MKFLYAPWRTDYTNDTSAMKKEGINADECVFCSQLQENRDAHYYILRRFDHCVLMLNKFPYNAGHLLIIPFVHCDNLNKLKKEAQSEMMALITHATTLVQTVLGAPGVNIGINIGKAAGAGIPSHLHAHVLPRWHNDTNFMPTLGNTKVVSYDLDTVYHTLKPAVDLINLTA